MTHLHITTRRNYFNYISTSLFSSLGKTKLRFNRVALSDTYSECLEYVSGQNRDYTGRISDSSKPYLLSLRFMWNYWDIKWQMWETCHSHVNKYVWHTLGKRRTETHSWNICLCTSLSSLRDENENVILKVPGTFLDLRSRIIMSVYCLYGVVMSTRPRGGYFVRIICHDLARTFSFYRDGPFRFLRYTTISLSSKRHSLAFFEFRHYETTLQQEQPPPIAGWRLRW